MKSSTSEFGTRCLLARRLVERGVRFVQIYSGGGPVSVQWDAHSNLVENHEKMCGMTDVPVAGLLHGSKTARTAGRDAGHLGAEFGRLPMSQGGNGRDHNPHGFTMWFAGGGVKPGIPVGETDELGLRATVKPPAHARFPRDHPESARPGPEPSVVPAQRPKRKVNRFRRKCNSRNARVALLPEPRIPNPQPQNRGHDGLASPLLQT